MGCELRTRQETIIPAWISIDRYGSKYGRFVSVYDGCVPVTFEQSSLPCDPDKIGEPNTYVIVKDLSADALNLEFSKKSTKEKTAVVRYLLDNFNIDILLNGFSVCDNMSPYLSLDNTVLKLVNKNDLKSFLNQLSDEDLMRVVTKVDLHVAVGKITDYFD